MYTAAFKQANKILEMMKRIFVDRSKEIILALYKSLVRPYLGYCIPVWDPYLVESWLRAFSDGPLYITDGSGNLTFEL